MENYEILELMYTYGLIWFDSLKANRRAKRERELAIKRFNRANGRRR